MEAETIQMNLNETKQMLHQKDMKLAEIQKAILEKNRLIDEQNSEISLILSSTEKNIQQLNVLTWRNLLPSFLKKLIFLCSPLPFEFYGESFHEMLDNVKSDIEERIGKAAAAQQMLSEKRIKEMRSEFCVGREKKISEENSRRKRSV
eukprot:GHVP01041695.1.p1 GENE.GHVP01041695.1~~GHVP01041695.1.p1  ORF type:complete len:148 (+),score=36.23 GHVP01041695.1:64-507(+)